LIEIRAHTNGEGERDDNLALSQRWANALRDRLVSEGIAVDTVLATGYGEERPAAGDPDAIENQRIVVFIRYE
jgi:outer membrane protein OmpA-like peptidoglycan-associated protein